MIVSPLMNVVPIFLDTSPSILSSVSSSTMFMWMSKALSNPMYCFPFFSSTITFLSLALFNASNGLDSISYQKSVAYKNLS